MALTCAQILNLARQDAKVIGYTSQSGQILNAVLNELCETYDFDLTRGTVVIPLNQGSGPYTLPADYLRADPNDVFFTITGVPYCLIPVDLSEYDNMVQTPGFFNYPTFYATDMSQTPPIFYVWAPSSGAYPLTIRYRKMMPDIVTPETSTDVPWFPFTNYLRRRVAGELMMISDDSRAAAFLGDTPEGAQGMLNRYLKLKDDKSDRTAMVKLDRRLFGNNFARLNSTKQVGW